MARVVDLGGTGMAVSCDMTPRILIADDQPDLLDALTLLLKGQGIEYDAVSSPDAAVRALESRAFDLVLMDLNYTGDTTSGREGIGLLARVQVPIGVGDRLVLYTDGLTEARDESDEEFGEDRLLQAAITHRGCSAPSLQARLVAAVASFTGGHLQDDATLIVLASDQG